MLIVPYRIVANSPLISEYSKGTITNVSVPLISKKGLIFKTWDGWIPLGMTTGVDNGAMLDKWYFTVANGDMKVVECIRENKKVDLEYTDNIIVPYRMGLEHQAISCKKSKKE